MDLILKRGLKDNRKVLMGLLGTQQNRANAIEDYLLVYGCMCREGLCLQDHVILGIVRETVNILKY